MSHAQMKELLQSMGAEGFAPDDDAETAQALQILAGECDDPISEVYA